MLGQRPHATTAESTSRISGRPDVVLMDLRMPPPGSLSCLGEGLSNAQIAGRLYLSEATVKGYVSLMLLKPDCANRTQAGLLTHHAGLAAS